MFFAIQRPTIAGALQVHNNIAGANTSRLGKRYQDDYAAAEGVHRPTVGDMNQDNSPGYEIHPGTGADTYEQHGHAQGLHHSPSFAQQMYYGPGMPPHPGMPSTESAEHNSLSPVNMQPDLSGVMGGHVQGGPPDQDDPALQRGPPGVRAAAGVPHGCKTAVYRNTSPDSAPEGRNSSLSISTSTLTKITKTTWADFDKSALHVALLSYWFTV